MKKFSALLLFGTMAFTTVLAQQNTTSVETIPTKDTQFENTVTVNEFNTIVNTLRGIYNFFTEDKFQLGINEPTPASSLTLDVGGRVGAEEFCDENGEHCIDPKTWDARPQLELQPAGANCSVKYRVKDQKYESEWQETNLNNDPIGNRAVFNSGLINNCGGAGCAVQMALKCEPNLAVTEAASCRLRYRVNHLEQSSLTPWVTTNTTNDSEWQEGTWSSVVAPESSWGDGLNIQAGIDCASPDLRCQVGYRLHNENETPDWSLSQLTDGPGWKDAEQNKLSADTVRACDRVGGCGLQMQSRCVGTVSTLKTALYSCPKVKDDRCPSLCNGQISLDDKCSYQKLGGDDQCSLLLTENCEKLGHLVQ